MDLVEKIAQHLYQRGWKGNENNIDWMVRNEFVEQSKEKPSQETVRATIERLKELSAQNKK
jgi:hypothetical protein